MKLSNKAALLSVGAVLALFGASAFAGTTGAEFQGLYQTLYDWATGYLGRAFAIAAFIIGAGIGLARTSAIPALVGVVMALFMFYIPTVINNIVSAVI